jgi:hypothetical protein
MNRQQRRAAKAHKPHARTAPEDAGWLYEITLIGPEEATGLLLAAAGGDRRATAIAHAALKVVARVTSAAKTDPSKLCLSCPAELLDLRFVAALSVPKWDSSAPRIVGAGICWDCAGHERALEKAAAGFRAIWPDLRPISPPSHHHQGSTP